MHQSLARSDRDLEPRRESLVPRRVVSTRPAAPRDAQAARNAPSAVERRRGLGLRIARQPPRAPVDGQRPRARRYRHRRPHRARHAGRRGDMAARGSMRIGTPGRRHDVRDACRALGACDAASGRWRRRAPSPRRAAVRCKLFSYRLNFSVSRAPTVASFYESFTLNTQLT